MPIVDENNVEESNKLIEQYNSEVEAYNEYVNEYNAQVDATYEAEKAEVNANNTFVEHVQDEIAEDTSEARGFENYTTDSEEVPTDWTDETTEEELKTIAIEKSDNPSGETVRVINLHVYLDDSSPYAPDSFYNFIDDTEFELSEELCERAVLTEWETAEIDLNDTVMMSGENSVFAGNIVYLNGVRKWMGANPSFYFFREIEGYTQGLWYQSGDMVASNATVQESEYDSVGTTHVVEFEEQEREVSYLYNGEPQTETVVTRTDNIYESVKPIFSIFTYMFHRLANEPEVMEEPVKGDYLEPVNTMELLVPSRPEPEPPIVIPEPIPEPAPEPTPEPIPEPAPEIIPISDIEFDESVERIIDEEIPLAVNVEKWSVINLLLLVFTIFTLLRFNKEKNYNVINYLAPVSSLGLFIWTENVHNPWTWVDKWTIWMLVIYIVAILFRIKWQKNKVA